MNREQVIELIEYFRVMYPNYEPIDGTVDAWLDVLQSYDESDVKANLKNLMGEEKYQNNPPQVALLTKGLTKVNEKIDLSKSAVLCPRCHRPFNTNEEIDKHFNRCSSVDYVIREMKKWFHKDLTRKYLFSLSDEEFEKKYNDLLHYIYNHTMDMSEKKRIGFIFNPPNKETARSYLNETIVDL